LLVPELVDATHPVVGLSRSDAGAAALTRAGAEVFRGDVNDPDRLRKRATENLKAALDAKRHAEAGLQDAFDRVRAATMRDWIGISARLNEQREGRR
jgi:nucleoside-diphosphate-sugar epimerase